MIVSTVIMATARVVDVTAIEDGLVDGVIEEVTKIMFTRNIMPIFLFYSQRYF